VRRDTGVVRLADGGTLHFEDLGSGSAVVLVHPGLWDSRTWDPQIEPLLATGCRVLRYDVRGYGRSSDPTGPYSDVDDLAELLAARGIERAALVGCSMGGDIAIRFTLTHPERVWALVPVASGLQGFPWDEEELGPVFEPIQRAVEAGDLQRAVDLAMHVWAPLGTDDPDGWRIREIAMGNTRQFVMDESLQLPSDPAPVDWLEAIDAPTLVLVGDTDVSAIERIADLLAARIPGARKVLIEQADHVVNLRQPDRFNQVVLDFLARTRED
jgi:pimeloyl-ACP methyl ester carboxylesterase